MKISERSKEKIKIVIRDVFDGWYHSLSRCGDTETEIIKVNAIEHILYKMIDERK